MKHGDHGAAFHPPTSHQAHQVFGGALVDRRERLVEQDDGGILQQQAGKQGALKFADRKLLHRAFENILKSGGGGRLRHALKDFITRPAVRTKAPPSSKRNQLADFDRERPVKLSLLRQIREIMVVARRTHDGSGLQPQGPGDCL